VEQKSGNVLNILRTVLHVLKIRSITETNNNNNNKFGSVEVTPFHGT